MTVNIYSKVGGEKLVRVIARHATVQSRLEAEARHITNDAKRRLAAHRRATDTSKMSDKERAAFYRSRTRVYYAKAKIDHHIVLEKPGGNAFHIEVKNRYGRGGLSILRGALKAR